MSRQSVFKNFEYVYLRHNQCKKTYTNIDDVNEFIKSPMFNKCVNRITNLTYEKHYKILLQSGFDRDDLRQTLTVFGSQFLSYKHNWSEEKDIAYVFMKFLRDRLCNFFIQLNTKFQLNERIKTISATQLNLSNIPQEDDDISPILQSKKARLNEKKNMKRILQENIELYQDRLAEIATSKFVNGTVRKKARSMCKKNNIDYIQWALNKVKIGSAEIDNFILEPYESKKQRSR